MTTPLDADISSIADELKVPGIAVGIDHEHVTEIVAHGVVGRSDHDRPVGPETLFQIGSTAKTFTAALIMILVDHGVLRLDHPVHQLLPELRLGDEEATRTVTVAHLLNHTAGWDGGDDWTDSGEGSDAVRQAVASFAELPQQFAPGQSASYNNAAFVVAGRLIEVLTRRPYEQALAEMILEPLKLGATHTALNEIMTRPFALGHQATDAGLTVVRPWSDPPGYLPAGARIACSIEDLLAWARFQLGDGRTPDGARLLAEASLRAMHQPSTRQELMPGTQIGYGWLLRTVDGVRLIEHHGDVSGQHSSVTVIPERECAITVLTNCTPTGREAAERIVRGILQSRLGLVDRPPELLTLGPNESAAYTGRYRTEGIELEVVADTGSLIINGTIYDGDAPGETLAFPVGMLPDDRYLVTGGPFEGLQGEFVRVHGAVVAVKHVGRLVPRAGGAADGSGR